MSDLPAVGFIGLGAMGWPMAARIAAAGHRITVTDVSSERKSSFVLEVGGIAADSPAAVAKTSDVLITMLPTSDIVANVMTGELGACASLRKGTVVLEMSSGSPATTRKIAQSIAEVGGELIDAPVSGGVPRAKTGDLAIMAGGQSLTIDRVEPILLCMGKSVFRTGDVGSAHAMKALNNLASAAGMLASIEVLLIGKRFGLDTALMVDALNASSGMNNTTQKKLKQFILSRQFNSGFGLDLMVKDLGIALDLAQQVSIEAPFSERCLHLWKTAANVLGPGHDHTEVAKLSEKVAGFELS